jgi:hypothetical protein
VVTVDWDIPVAWFSAVTLAPGTTAPLGSVTVPLMPPRPAWAQAAVPAVIESIEIHRDIRRNRSVILVIILAISNQIVDIQTFE